MALKELRMNMNYELFDKKGNPVKAIPIDIPLNIRTSDFEKDMEERIESYLLADNVGKVANAYIRGPIQSVDERGSDGRSYIPVQFYKIIE